MPDPSMSDRLIRLASTDSHVYVVPPGNGQPFTVPQFPMSQLVWLDHLTTAFHERRHRCLCVALMLDLTCRAWGRPEIPTQHCDLDGVRWTWNADDFSNRSAAVLVGGTYQSAVLDDIHEAIALVPPCDGVHFVGVKAITPGIHAFVHADGQTVAIDARRLVIDDVAHALDNNADRLTLG